MQSDITQRKEQLFDQPMEQFEHWFALAKEAGLPKPEGFCLSTVGTGGAAHGRWVLHKGVVDGCLSFYTNFLSEKAKDIELNPKVSATFYWDEPLDVQVRVEGEAVKLEDKYSDEYFNSRPRGSQIGAWASPQSTVISSREALEELVAKVERDFENSDKVDRPEFWGGYKIKATAFDFMLMRRDRLHDRYRFELKEGIWQKQRLAP